jgi:hypothetical protein
VLRVFPTLPATHPCARPGNEAFFIRNDLSDGTVVHDTLYFLRNTHDDTCQFESYYSARGAWHHQDQQTAGNQFTQGIQAQGWYRLNPNRAIVQPIVSRDPPARQLGGWECGVYVAIYAWALALGLDISQFTGIPAIRGHAFEGEAVRLMGLALRGFVSSDLIEALMKCYCIVPQDAESQPTVVLIKRRCFSLSKTSRIESIISMQRSPIIGDSNHV